MNQIMIFTDGSAHPQSRVGYGAYIIVHPDEVSLDPKHFTVHLRRFEDTSSAQLEIQTVLWALNSAPKTEMSLAIYTDSQTITHLHKRRRSLEDNEYRTKANQQLKHHQLYRDFYSITDQTHCVFIKVKGHKRSDERDWIDRVFHLVDRASRSALRAELRSTKNPK